jgi:hypothetical protein
LGATHAEYGDKPEFIAIIGEALFDILKTMLKGECDRELHGKMRTIDFPPEWSVPYQSIQQGAKMYTRAEIREESVSLNFYCTAHLPI